jgi:phage recombination protein Bet
MNLAIREPQLTTEIVRQHLCPKATESEAFIFIQFCLGHALNPFLRDAHLIKYSDTDKATIVVGKDAVIRRCQGEPDYRGFQAGIVVRRGTEVIEKQGALVEDNEVLLGGWCSVSRDSFLYGQVQVSMREYNRGQALWKSMPATMIRKVAVVQAHREAYPGLTAGMYQPEEMPMAVAESTPGVFEPIALPTGAPTPDAPTDETRYCPLHGIAWMATRFGAQHRTDDRDRFPKGFCKPSQAYSDELVILEDQLGIDRDATNLALKRYYPNRDDGRPGGKTWSLLSLAEIEETLGLMRGRVKQQAQQEAQQEAQPDQDEEGEI